MRGRGRIVGALRAVGDRGHSARWAALASELVEGVVAGVAAVAGNGGGGDVVGAVRAPHDGDGTRGAAQAAARLVQVEGEEALAAGEGRPVVGAEGAIRHVDEGARRAALALGREVAEEAVVASCAGQWRCRGPIVSAQRTVVDESVFAVFAPFASRRVETVKPVVALSTGAVVWGGAGFAIGDCASSSLSAS